MTRIKHWHGVAGILIALVTGSPQISWACAVCSAGREDENRLAFILMTAFLTFLPLILVGSVIWWLRGRARRLEAAAQHPTLQEQQGEPLRAPVVPRRTRPDALAARFSAWRTSR